MDWGGVAGIFGAFVLAFIFMVIVLRRASTPARKTAAALPGLILKADVRSLGRTSAGVGQVRGNGTLALTDEALRFFQWVPSDEVTIPLADVVRVDTTRSHLGKSVGAELLRVTWTTPQGEDSIAWQVRHPERWQQAIDGVGTGNDGLR